ncbi:hypothetical protein BLOT_012408 [Blomia tropicalis]|nr:hypothetical protein BLOT_012408 [Blomia tropicalis]
MLKDKNKDGKSVLHLAIVEKLIKLFDDEKDFSIELIKNKNKNDYSILHTAVVIGNVEGFEKLYIVSSFMCSSSSKQTKNKPNESKQVVTDRKLISNKLKSGPNLQELFKKWT